MEMLIRIAIALFSSPSLDDAEALHRFAPQYVSVDSARDHIWAARVSAAVYDVDADMVLAISYHESRFTDGVVAAEPGGRVSCGAMTPYPTKTCETKPLLAQYLDGARHWAVDWRRAGDIRSEREALLGYAGGYALVRRCRQGSVLRHKTHGDDLCATADVFNGLRARIVRERRQKLKTAS
jgi:hypothetical protein